MEKMIDSLVDNKNDHWLRRVTSSKLIAEQQKKTIKTKMSLKVYR